MSSPEQYSFEQPVDPNGFGQQPDLLPDEFQWQPINANPPVGVDGSPGTDGSISTSGGFVPQDPTIAIDGTGYTNTDGTGTGGVVVDNGQGSTGMVPGMDDAYILPQGGTDQYVVPQGGTDQLNTIPPEGQGVYVDPGTGGLPPMDQQVQPGADQGYIPIVPDQTGQVDQTQIQPPADQTQTAAGADQTTQQPTKSGGGIDAMWWADRALTLGSTAATAQMLVPNLSTFMAEGATVPSLSSLRAVPKNEWMTAASTDIGKKLGGAFLATTLADATLLKGYDTSLATIAVDVATPFLINKFMPGMGVGKTILATLGAHTAEKVLFEGKKEE